MKLASPEAATLRVLVVDDDPFVAESLVAFMREEGHEAESVGDVPRALAVLAKAEREALSDDANGPIELVICDLSLPGADGIELLRLIRERHAGTAVIILTAYGSIESAVRALRLGAADYLTKPVVDDELRFAIERAIAQQGLLAANATLRRRLDAKSGLERIVGSDPRMLKVFDLIDSVASSRTTVLMTGESGVGKSLVAHAIHQRSPRRDGPFVELACGAIPETLLESELFGHVKGAFTGAHADKIGRFLAADGGTIFLDEINSASPAMQLKLLRVIQERKFEPVGSTKTVEVDVRILLAANQPLEQMVARGEFRQDLYYRINVVTIDLPPLRDRVGDIKALAEHFLRHHARELGKSIMGFSPDAATALHAYAYPGNVRELANIVERAAVLTRGVTIQIDDLPAHVANPDKGGAPMDRDDEVAWSGQSLEEALREPERRVILRALEACEWNRQKTADALGINRTTLYKKMKSLGIEA